MDQEELEKCIGIGKGSNGKCLTASGSEELKRGAQRSREYGRRGH